MLTFKPVRDRPIAVKIGLAVAALVKFFGSDGWGIAALTIWSLLYLWLALRIRSASGASSTSRQEWVGA